jgi:hypothetical protein
VLLGRKRIIFALFNFEPPARGTRDTRGPCDTFSFDTFSRAWYDYLTLFDLSRLEAVLLNCP